MSAAFIQPADGPVDDLIAPIEHTLADTNIGETYGITALPHLRDFAVTGPHRVTGVSETPSRRRDLHVPADARRARRRRAPPQIVKRLASRGYRGHVHRRRSRRTAALLQQGREGGDFEAGIRLAVQAMLAQSALRVPARAGAGALVQAGDTYRIDDLDLASRLSFFLWGTVPDAELDTGRDQGLLEDAGAASSSRCGACWPIRARRRWRRDSRRSGCACRTSRRPVPIRCSIPQWDETLADVASAARPSCSSTASSARIAACSISLTADYTFVNERIAKHYGIPNVMGSTFPPRARFPTRTGAASSATAACCC